MYPVRRYSRQMLGENVGERGMTDMCGTYGGDV
jgi:hypothetical protein